MDNKINKWISVNDNLPECWSQHGDIVSSGWVLTYAKSCGEYEINEYITTMHVFNSGRWISDDSDYPVTHWKELTRPEL